MNIRDELIQNKITIIDRYEKGDSTNKIAKDYNCNSANVYLLLKEWGINVTKRKKFTGDLADHAQTILTLFDQGFSAYKISQQIGISKPTVLRFLKKNGKDTSLKNKVDVNNLLKDKIDQVLSMYESGQNQNEIAKITGHRQVSIHRLLKSNDIEIRDNTRYTVNESFFEKIDSEAKAWVLGWWYADGNVVDDKIRLAITDKELVEKIAKLMDYTGEVNFKKRKQPHHKDQWELRICRKKLVEDIIKLGCFKRKSMILEFPTFDQVPEKYIRHFIRGYFEGDGSIYPSRKKYWQVCIVSSENFINGLRNYLKQKFDMKTSWQYRYSHTTTMQMRITRQADVIRFLDWIYKDANYVLDRKFQKYKKALKKRV